MYTAEEGAELQVGLAGFEGIDISLEQPSEVETRVTPGSGTPHIYFISS